MREFFVSPSGNDANEGTLGQPFLTIAKGIRELKPGDILNLRQGNYVESVEIIGLHGSQLHPIVIRSHKGEHATIDGTALQFRDADNDDWELASVHDFNAHPDEFVSVEKFTLINPKDRVNRGPLLIGSRIPA